MSSKTAGDFEFTKGNIDSFLREIAKEYRKRGGKGMPAEIILIGGAAVLVRYNFRDMTTDIDGIIEAASTVKDAINCVRDRHNLASDWLNEDFKRTDSYTVKLLEFAKFYKSFSNGALCVRTIDREYLIAMKLRAGRQYKNDLSDVIGILSEHEKKGDHITLEHIRKAAFDLYGEWDAIPEASRNFIENVINLGNFDSQYENVRAGERETKQLLSKFRRDYPEAVKESGTSEIIERVQEKSKKAAVLAKLRKRKHAEQNQNSECGTKSEL